MTRLTVAGFGFRQGASVAALQDAFARAGGKADAVATATDKNGPLAQAFAAAIGLPLILVKPDDIADQPANPSPHVPDRYGRRSLAEAAALAAAGRGSVLTATRITSADRMATVALAEGTKE